MKEIQSYTTHVVEGTLLNANEMSINMDKVILKEVLDALKGVQWNRYPDDDCRNLREAYGNVLNIDSNKILAGNGSDQILGLLIGTFLGKGKILYTLDPDFSMYDYYATTYEADIKKYKVSEDGSFDVNDFIEASRREKANILLFSNPNNPTGHTLTNQEIEKILSSVSIPVIVDEAYAEFADESAISLIDQYSNLYVTRTLSKAYGLAGIRVGFLISQKQNVEAMKKADVPYVLNCISQTAATVVLKHADYYQDWIQQVKKYRDEWVQTPFQFIRVFASQANFVMVKPKNLNRFLSLFERENIVIRKYAGKEYVRITIGTVDENERILSIFKEYEKEEAECDRQN